MAGSLRRTDAIRGLRAASLLFLFQFLTLGATAHVKEPAVSSPIDRTLEATQPEIGSVPRLDGAEASEPGPVLPGQGCGFWFGTRRSSTDAVLASSVLGAPSVSEVRLDSGRAGDPVYREVLSLFDGFDSEPDVVLAGEGVTPAGTPCPLYVAVESGGARQTFWRYAPDDEPEGWFDDGGRRLGGAVLATPRPGSRISSPFGPRRYYGRLSGGGFHDGIDFESRVGQPIYAAADGVVELRGTHFEYGLTVKIRHAALYTTLYAHMSRFAPGIAVDAPVRKGELIGFVGMTGRSTGAHLHFSTIVNGRFVDPAPFLSDNANHALSARTFATFRKWQDDIRAAVTGGRDRKPRPQLDEFDWTTRI